MKYAFEAAPAASTKRKKVTAVHKANIQKYSDGLFLEVSREVAKEYPDIEFEDRIVDNMCMQLVQKPELYDVLVLPNLYGDIISDLGAGLVGGLGVAPGANVGEAGAVFEATHGSAPKYKGQWKMNPTALILSGALMLDHLGEAEAAQRLEKAVAHVIKEGKDVTYDMKPNRDDPTAVGTKDVAQAIIRAMGSLSLLSEKDFLRLIGPEAPPTHTGWATRAPPPPPPPPSLPPVANYGRSRFFIIFPFSQPLKCRGGFPSASRWPPPPPPPPPSEHHTPPRPPTPNSRKRRELSSPPLYLTSQNIVSNRPARARALVAGGASAY